jgi:cyanate lyase
VTLTTFGDRSARRPPEGEAVTEGLGLACHPSTSVEAAPGSALGPVGVPVPRTGCQSTGIEHDMRPRAAAPQQAVSDRRGPAQPRDDYEMNRHDITAEVLAAKRRKGLSFTQIAEHVGADRVRLTAALHGQHPLTSEQATALSDLLELPAEAAGVLEEIPTRGSFGTLPPADPTVYRLYEVLQVYGPALKALIHEDFGDGIMSAINFNLALERRESDAGPRVRITLDGKFLPYQWEG